MAITLSRFRTTKHAYLVTGSDGTTYGVRLDDWDRTRSDLLASLVKRYVDTHQLVDVDTSGGAFCDWIRNIVPASHQEGR